MKSSTVTSIKVYLKGGDLQYSKHNFKRFSLYKMYAFDKYIGFMNCGIDYLQVETNKNLLILKKEVVQDLKIELSENKRL